MGEVSYLKLKLSDMEGKQGYGAERQHKAEVGLLAPHICVERLVLSQKQRSSRNLLQLKTWKCILGASKSVFGPVKIFLKLSPRKFQANCGKKDEVRAKNLAFCSNGSNPEVSCGISGTQ